jgi:tetratricopeptide (TPR) repeat protein
MRHLSLVLALAATPAAAAPMSYGACMDLVARDPAAARAAAESWLADSRDPAAEHCLAMALAALGARDAAALRLSDLAARPGPLPAEARAEMLAQAAGFWLEAGDAGLARAAADRAIKLAPRAPELLALRAEIGAAEGDWPRAKADLDKALALRPGDPQLLTLRAAARRNAGDERGALADARTAAAAAAVPADKAMALFERGAAEAALGEPARARRDWLDAIAAAPDSPAAAQARASIQALDGR